ncbi:hypothetical protein OG379_09005 [Streptomyces sp. NBC_01166]|uniref:hypothetical protein n=1 Tax=Streptomyces sp. NBC_01166 TaxID=2903755 RepID=UPI00386678B9|nr:hypothetical protein OG379_09005 [Streptomyces sp. NBC_01166]
MSRRVSLPGADELFRTTGGMGLQGSSPAERRRKANGEARVPAPAGGSDSAPSDTGPGGTPGSGDTPAGASQEEHSAADADGGGSRSRADGDDRGQAAPPRARTAPGQEQTGTSATVQPQRGRGGGRGANRRPSGRERHDEKITVYVSAEELMDLEHARLVLRGEHGLAVDRGRIVREAVAVVLADLESRGDASILVRRLRGR